MQSNANGDAARAHMQRTCLARANAPDFFAYLYKVKRARAHAQPSAGVRVYPSESADVPEHCTTGEIEF